MTSPDNASTPPTPTPYADRVYRSPAALAGGVLLLAIAAWSGADAVVRGEGRTPWLTLAGLLAFVPVVVAFTLRPAVFAGADVLRVRNPLRTITLPWSRVETVRARYSTEVVADGRVYTLWAVPVSVRARKKAAHQMARAAAGQRLTPALPAPADQAVQEMQELAERNAGRESAQGEPEVRWAYEVIVPVAAGAVLLALLLATG